MVSISHSLLAEGLLGITALQLGRLLLQLERRSLAVAGPEVRMVESLAPMWDEQRARNNGATPLQPPASPPRTPMTLSPFVTDAIRAQYQVDTLLLCPPA